MTETDRELLELAARAMGYEWRRDIADARNRVGKISLWIIGESTSWNPIDDDMYAFRLLVAMPHIDIKFVVMEAWQAHPGDMNAIRAYVRLAIVRAVAEIGRHILSAKQLPTNN